MWKDVSDDIIPELELTQDIPGIVKTGDIRFIVLNGSGAGDQYIFQGEIDLGEGVHTCNLAVYSLGPTWRVHSIRGFELFEEEEVKGYELFGQLLETLTELPRGSRESLAWLKNAWKKSTKYELFFLNSI